MAVFNRTASQHSGYVPDGEQYPRKPSFTAELALLLCAFTAGAGIMVYEFLAIRVMQPHFGGTLDVWAAEISVCLGGLAIGYALGGKLADRFHSMALMGAGLFIGGFLGLFIEPLTALAGDWLIDIEFGRRWHPILGSMISTFLPILALGTVLPQAIRFQSDRYAGVGRAAGYVSAVSTMGGILGTLITVMMLMPHIGTLTILYWSSGAMMVVAALTALSGRLLARSTVVFVVLAAMALPAQGQVRFETYSAYHHILVRDEGNTRILLFDNAQQSLMSLNDPYKGGFEYTDYFHVPKILDPTIDRAFFIGLGGGTGPKSFLQAYPDMQIQVAELDPAVVRVAREYFALPNDPRLKVQVGDGRQILRRASGKYGAVIMDAYATGPYGPYLPYHLSTQEFFRIVRDKLVNGGSFVFNVMGIFGGQNDDVIRHLLPTLESVFQAVYIFQATSSQNTVFVAQKIEPTKLQPNGTRDGNGWPNDPWLRHPLSAQEWRALAQNMGPEFLNKLPQMPQRVTQFSRAQQVRPQGQILTDDYAPVDLAPGRR